jgi:hypothetical protein
MTLWHNTAIMNAPFVADTGSVLDHSGRPERWRFRGGRMDPIGVDRCEKGLGERRIRITGTAPVLTEVPNEGSPAVPVVAFGKAIAGCTGIIGCRGGRVQRASIANVWSVAFSKRRVRGGQNVCL